MFSFLKRKDAEVLSHWYALVPNFQTSAKDFYVAIERELKARQIPGLDIARVEFSEGGALSAKREYLRMNRERLVFDICAAPFGAKEYFFSCRFAEIPPIIRPWEVAVMLFGIFAIYMVFYQTLGFFQGTFLLIVALGFTIWLLRNAVAIGLRDLDATLIRTPVIGPLYERFLRKETYYRQDTRIMYLDTVSNLVKQQVANVTGENGVKLTEVREYNPILRELYKPNKINPDSGDSTPS